jgi:hypothetical protein
VNGQLHAPAVLTREVVGPRAVLDGRMAPRILNFGPKKRLVVSFMLRPFQSLGMSIAEYLILLSLLLGD